MAEVTEQEAREAAAQIPAWVLLELSKEVREVLMWATGELSRRDAERAEREKPIDAEWLESIGFDDCGAWMKIKAGQNDVWWSKLRNNVGIDMSYVRDITTSGQLLDLLRALKGGA